MSTDPLVVVCRDPRDRQRARVRLSKLDGLGFDVFTPGARARFARPMLVATMAMADVVDGKIRWPTSHGPMPDRVQVAITRTHNQVAYPVLERMAAARRMAQMIPPPRQRVRLNPPTIPRISPPVPVPTYRPNRELARHTAP